MAFSETAGKVPSCGDRIIREYWQALANDIAIPISSLILDVEGFGDDQSTLVHSLIATELAQWVSVGFRIWANKVLVEKIIAVKCIAQTF